jgi:hypothetical protein
LITIEKGSWKVKQRGFRLLTEQEFMALPEGVPVLLWLGFRSWEVFRSTGRGNVEDLQFSMYYAWGSFEQAYLLPEGGEDGNEPE